MSLRTSLAIAAGKSSRFVLKHAFKRGSSLPGKIALAIDPNILEHLAEDYEIIVVSGTNGKTLTTSLIVNILEQAFGNVVTNKTGANLQQGIVATFLDAPHTSGKKFAVLEIDEATLPKVSHFIKPDLFVFTNVFRDQLDRYGEIYTTYQLLASGASQVPSATVLANGDMPIFNDSLLPNPKQYYGFNHLKAEANSVFPDDSSDGILCPQCQSVLHYRFLTYANQGDYYCPHCQFHRPDLSYTLTSIDTLSEHSASFTVDGGSYHIPIGGMYNIYNALAAIAVGEYYGIDATTIQQGLDAHQDVFGRQEIIQIDDKKVTIMLVKNPVGLNQVIDTIQLAQHPLSIISLLNDHYADGIDVSWIWDGHYEALQTLDIPHIYTGGTRIADMTLRLQVAGFDDRITRLEHDEDIISCIKQAPTEHIYVLATYTAMTQLRQLLSEKGYVQGGVHQA